MIEIWAPRYHDNVVLIAKHKVSTGMNTIVFSRAKHLAGKVFEILGDEIRKCPIDTNGRILCYAVPMDKLREVVSGQRDNTHSKV